MPFSFAGWRQRPVHALSILAAIVAIGVAPGTAFAKTIFIQSPSGNIACQLDSRYGALCTIFSSARQAEVTQHGRVRIFAQESNPPSEGVRTLRYGRSLSVRHVRCTSKRIGMQCVFRPSGHGFVAARGNIRRL